MSRLSSLHPFGNNFRTEDRLIKRIDRKGAPLHQLLCALKDQASFLCDRCGEPKPRKSLFRLAGCLGAKDAVICFNCKKIMKKAKCTALAKAYGIPEDEMFVLMRLLRSCHDHHARSKGRIAFSLTMPDILLKWIGCGGFCSLSGLPIRLVRAGANDGPASIDRIRSDLHYTPGNIQFVHAKVNRMKASLPQDDFLAFCRELSAGLTQKGACEPRPGHARAKAKIAKGVNGVDQPNALTLFSWAENAHG